ncbi:DExH-box ATP-dependent RNA helicase DExH12 [Camellia lanceoleosa]|nr:DExH-box ATP-dependent RNA helicase DExH12 [Camellia lanceoleosa]
MLSVIQQQLGGQPLNIVSGADDEILSVLKNETVKNPDKKKEIEKLLNPIPNHIFDQLVSIEKLINDYHDAGDAGGSTAAANGGNDALDDDVGVAVESEENEEEQEESDLDMVQDDEEDGDDVMEGHGSRATQIGGGIDDDDKQDANEGMTLNQSQKLAEKVLKILAEANDCEVETKLLVHLQFDKFSLIKHLLRNRLKIVWCTRLARAEDEEKRKKIKEKMLGSGPKIVAILAQFHATRAIAKERQKNLEKSIREGARQLKDESGVDGDRERRGLADSDADSGWLKGQRLLLDLENLAFHQGGLLMVNKKCELPLESYRNHKDMKKFIKVYETALFTAENILLCAPTGARKTNVAMLTILEQIALHRNEEWSFNHSNYKIVYVVPMKALVAEVVGNLSNRLRHYDVKVKELSGDQTFTRQQIEETQIIVTTPEKWDIITCKSETTPIHSL